MARLRAILPTAILFACASLTPASSQDVSAYPDKPVRLVIPLAPGGPSDILGRSVAHKLGEMFGQAFYAENRPGARAAQIGLINIARSNPPGSRVLPLFNADFSR